MGEALEYVLQNFSHIFLCKMVNFEDMQVLYIVYSIVLSLDWRFSTWSTLGIENSL